MAKSQMIVTFTIPGTPKGKMRHSTVVTLRCSACQRLIVGQRDRCPHCSTRNLYFVAAREYTPKPQAEYERFAAMCAAQGMTGMNKFVGPVQVECAFFFGVPKSRSKIQDDDWHTQRPDLDNCIKSVWDAMNQVCFADDCTVVGVDAYKQWTTGVPRTDVRIESL